MAVENASPYTATCPFQSSTGYSRDTVDMAGQNSSSAAYAFEQRVTQESGTH